MGRKQLLTRKSSKSRTDEPEAKGTNSDQRLKPKAQGRERIKIATPQIIQAFFLPQPGSSRTQARIF